MPVATGAVAVLVLGLGVAALAQVSPQPRQAPPLVTRSEAPAAAASPDRPRVVPAAATAATPLAGPTALAILALPAGTSGARLSAIPDRYLNDPPAARFRVPVPVRDTVGLAVTDGPPVIAWSEGGVWYELSSVRLTIPQLVHLASALE